MDEQEQTIDLRVLLRVFVEHWIPIIIAGILAAAIGFSLAAFVVPKRYTSEALMYVENSSGSRSETETLNINDINVAQKLVNTCQILFKSTDVLKELSKKFNEEYTVEQLNGMITIESVNSTEVLKITVVTTDPQLAYDIAAAEVSLATNEYQRVIKGGSIETVSQPTMPDTHTFPSKTRFALIGGAIGLIVVYLVYLIKELLDIKVKPDDDLAQLYDIPVFAEILDFEMAGKGGYKYSKYGYGKYGYSKYSNYGAYDDDNKREDELFAAGYDQDLDETEDDDDEEDIKPAEDKHAKSKNKKEKKHKEESEDADDEEVKKEVKAKNG